MDAHKPELIYMDEEVPEIGFNEDGEHCLCEQSDTILAQKIVNGQISSLYLDKKCCWKRLTQVKNRNKSYILPEDWKKLGLKRAQVAEGTYDADDPRSETPPVPELTGTP